MSNKMGDYWELIEGIGIIMMGCALTLITRHDVHGTGRYSKSVYSGCGGYSGWLQWLESRF